MDSRCRDGTDADSAADPRRAPGGVVGAEEGISPAVDQHDTTPDSSTADNRGTGCLVRDNDCATCRFRCDSADSAEDRRCGPSESVPASKASVTYRFAARLNGPWGMDRARVQGDFLSR